MITIRKSNDRGANHLEWLDSRHSFSFANYYDPDHMGVSVLKVINDDSVMPGSGFDTHSHQDMEIISYVKRGMIEHRDSMGNTKQLPTGDIQLMSAGTGIQHSEYNPSSEDLLEFLQIWIVPNRIGLSPDYQQMTIQSTNGLNLLISPENRDNVLKINQDAYLYQLILEPDQNHCYHIQSGRTLYLHLISGEMLVNDQKIQSGDGITIEKIKSVQLTGINQCEALIFDLP